MRSPEGQVSLAVDAQGVWLHKDGRGRLSRACIVPLQTGRSLQEGHIVRGGRAQYRILGNGNEAQQLGSGELGGPFVKVHAGCGLKAFHIAPVGSKAEVGLQD